MLDFGIKYGVDTVSLQYLGGLCEEKSGAGENKRCVERNNQEPER